jgi:rSAM/selenodomain-associated transferase 2
LLSVVIPALNAAEWIGPCLVRLREADEVIVVDGGSTDGTPAIARRNGAAVIVSERGRGRQLHAGARAARGDWFLFLHADTLLEPGWRAAADRHCERQRGRPACFRFALDAKEWQARVVEAGVALRVALGGRPYGDQGLLISRRLYELVGGYRPLPLMEDIDLVRRLPLRKVEPLDPFALTSAERWRRDGWLRRWARNFLCLTAWRLGIPAAWIARLYG